MGIKKGMWWRLLLALVAVGTLSLPALPTAHANETETTDSASSASAVDEQSPVPDSQAADNTKEQSDGGVAAQNQYVSVDVPGDAAEGIAVKDSSGASVTLTPPGARRAEDGEAVGGTVIYEDAAPGTDVTAQPVDGGVRQHVVLKGPEAPNRFLFAVKVTGGGSVRLNDDGTASVLNASGEEIAAIDKPWARDAEKNELPTRFELDSAGRLMQYVDTTAVTSWPVVADPAIIVGPFVVAFTYVVRGALARCGLGWLGGAAQQALFHGWVWNEVRRAGKEGCVWTGIGGGFRGWVKRW